MAMPRMALSGRVAHDLEAALRDDDVDALNRRIRRRLDAPSRNATRASRATTSPADFFASMIGSKVCRGPAGGHAVESVASVSNVAVGRNIGPHLSR